MTTSPSGNERQVPEVHVHSSTMAEVARRWLPNWIIDRYKLGRALRPLVPRECPICGFVGSFRSFGAPPRSEGRCSRCRSLERHRLFKLALDRGELAPGGRFVGTVLHFAPERALSPLIRAMAERYVTADFLESADLRLNIEDIALEDASLGVVIANHVLEHVDDRKAAREICRVLAPGGQLIASVPIVEGWDETYEDPAITDNTGREVHFGQNDHVRIFGRDFRDRIMSGGFSSVREITAGGADSARYSLIRGEKIFVFTK